MRQPRPPKEYWERFDEKNEGQRGALLALDRLAVGQVARMEIDSIDMRYPREFGCNFSPAMALYYAFRAEAEDHKNTALCWHEKYRDMTNDAAHLRRFLKRRHLLPMLVDETPAEDRAELRRIGNIAMASDLMTACSAFEKCGDKGGMRRVFDRAVHTAARVTIGSMEQKGFVFGKPEQLTCGRAMIRKSCATDAILAFLVERELQKKLGPELVSALITRGETIKEIDECARRLDIVLTKKQLVRLYEMARGANLRASCAVEAARRLAELDDWWKKRLQEILAWARNVQLGERNTRSAEAYGKECGRPLTMEELLEVQSKLPRDENARVSHELETAKVVTALILERINDHLPACEPEIAR